MPTTVLTPGMGRHGRSGRNFATTFSLSGGMRLRSHRSHRRRRGTLAALVCVTAVAAGAPPGALGAAEVTGSAVQHIFAQCASGHLSGNYTVGELQQALSVMPATVSQYTSCPDVVQTAIVRTQRHQGADATAGSHTAFLPLPIVAILAALVGTTAVLGLMALRRR
jgi:hypothetical protein